ncbi:unnamed protein product [Caenorhabditis auriculariae]|uniref:Uncharacterized protein n=1 Tax=Caenorhabditis auriculariae TaxID=2777116 RepID=A0A8S1HHI7_9PELO|nr:unnamed protein product [Caenorhabditis auriculariae]
MLRRGQSSGNGCWGLAVAGPLLRRRQVALGVCLVHTRRLAQLGSTRRHHKSHAANAPGKIMQERLRVRRLGQTERLKLKFDPLP